jgi:preprotein translocase subunit SecY
LLGTKNVDSIGKKNSFGKNNELRNRILFTLFILLIYRMGTYIPIPGVNIDVIREFFTNNSRGIMGVLDMFSGGSLGRMTVFALNIIPYIAASIMMQLFVVVFPSLNELKKDSASGRKQINQYTRYLTLFVCALQSFGIAIALESMGGVDGTKAVVDAGWFVMSAEQELRCDR